MYLLIMSKLQNLIKKKLPLEKPINWANAGIAKASVPLPALPDQPRRLPGARYALANKKLS